jgi:uncharacterized damage-inducible protein DinB
MEENRAWREHLAALLRGGQAHLKKDPATSLFARIPWGQRQTILREALLVADHEVYHVGQLVLLRRMLGA